MTRRFFIAVALLVGLCSCDRPVPEIPTAPTTSTPLTPTAAARERQPLVVVGRIVDSTDRPVAGANVTQWDSTNTAISDASGGFGLSIAVDANASSFWVTVEKAGFETSELARNVSGAAGTTLRLHQIRSIAAGESTRLSIGPDDSACGYHWGYLCRRLRIRSGATGTVSVEVVSETPSVGVLLGNVGFAQRMESRVSMPVAAGSEISIEIATGSPLGAPANVTVHTALR